MLILSIAPHIAYPCQFYIIKFQNLQSYSDIERLYNFRKFVSFYHFQKGIRLSEMENHKIFTDIISIGISTGIRSWNK